MLKISEPIHGVVLFQPVETPDSNIYVIDNEIMVDSGTGHNFAEVRAEMEKKCNVKTIHTLVNTHYHHDHTGGNKKFRDWLKCKIAVHEADKPRVEEGETLAEMFGDTGRMITADIRLKDRDILRTKNFKLEVIHAPGHTPGSICLFEREHRFLISGDVLFADAYGRTDLPGGDYAQMEVTLAKLLRFDVITLLPGHGPIKPQGVEFLIRQIMTGMVEARLNQK